MKYVKELQNRKIGHGEKHISNDNSKSNIWAKVLACVVWIWFVCMEDTICCDIPPSVFL